MKRNQWLSWGAWPALTASLAALSPASAEDTLTATTFGGAFEAAAVKAWIAPYSEASGVKVVTEQYDGDLAKLRAMVEAGNTTLGSSRSRIERRDLRM